jgi:Fe-Mn family superoxide dismutase
MKRSVYMLAVFFVSATLVGCQQQQPKNGEGENIEPITYDKDKSKSDKNMAGLAGDVPDSRYYFGDLPYKYDELEPAIDHRTMKLHYDKHHKGYYKKFLKAIKGTEAAGKPVLDIFSRVSEYPAGVRNNGGGYYNHWLFWYSLSPRGGGEPQGSLAEAINRSFGSFENFKSEFNKAASGVFGSGWAWLILSENDKLKIVNTSNQDNPLMDVNPVNGHPIINLDVWEHAYYVKYNNRRSDYISNYWKIVDWQKAQKRFEKAQKGKVFHPNNL